MHIGFLLPEYPHKKITTACAGIGTSSQNIVLGLLKDGHQVSVFIYGQDCNEVIEEGSLMIHKIKRNQFKYFGFYLYRKQLNAYINKIISEDKIDLLEAVDWTGITAFMKFKIPHVLRLHGTDAFFCNLDKRPQSKKNYFFEKVAYKNATAVIGVSNFVFERSNQIFKIQKKGIVIPNGLFFENIPTHENTIVEENTILYFGSIIRKKGILELAAIFNKVILERPNAKLSFLGTDVPDIQTKTSTIGLFTDLLSAEALKNFKYLGVVPYIELTKVIAKTQICVFPSLAESFGMVTIEAMYLKKAIVNTNYPWATEIIKNEEMGLLEDPKNHEAYAQKIMQLLDDKNLCKIIGEKANKEVVKNFSIKTITAKNTTFYKKIIADEV
ncbi:glycosyltransferase family 4 protein [Polaribacter sp. NJDZ03]|uniref:glycosyltransferase family 4 protein n=1 Tax=Polaribacter sp. NJDZ03 TaxID=2855841 RepID=UPI001C4A05A1|nr:glycosyltransferase family 4 protein [Polaribacter sp. NJDZ03]